MHGSVKVKGSMRVAAVVAVMLVLTAAGTAQATVLLSDNFNSENAGAGTLNYAGFANWTVSDGSVDLCGNGFCDVLPGNGLYVDMDGSTGNAGKLTSVATFTLTPGLTYTLSFDLAGNQRGGTGDAVTVQVAMGLAFSEAVHQNQSRSSAAFRPASTDARTAAGNTPARAESFPRSSVVTW